MSVPATGPPVNILLVDDKPEDVTKTRRVLDRGAHRGKLHVVESGEEALLFLRREEPFLMAPRPKLVLLDLDLPGISGLDVLREMNQDDLLRPIPVIIFTSIVEPDELLAAYDERARAFITKPEDPGEFESCVEHIEAFWLNIAQLPTN